MDETTPSVPQQDEVLKLFEQEERGYFRRLADMFRGLTQPRESLAHKEAMKELQRQWAPLLGISFPLLVCAIMCSVSIGGKRVPPPAVEVEVIEPTQAEQLDEVEPPPPEELDIETDIVDDFVTDVPSPTLGEVTQEPISATPPVQMTASVVKMVGIPTRGSGGGGIGGGTRLAGDMVGMFIDLSRNAQGQPRPELAKNRFGQFFKDINHITTTGFTKESFAPFFVVPQRVYLSHLVLPRVKSAIGPETFKVDKQVKKGSPWAAVYRGQLQPEASGTYRLAGLYDDVMVVRVNGKVVFEFAWDTRNAKAGAQTAIKSGWTLKDPAGAHKLAGYENTPLTYGDWFTLRADQSVPIEILIGDNGGDGGDGGRTGGILLLEKQGETYAKTANGVPLLPPFCTTRLTFTERQRLEEIADASNTKGGHYAFAPKSVPVMNTCGKQTKSMTQDDIEVDVGDL
ncbi:MAG: hypothetical protein ACI4RT_09260 [Candidatus Spyradenecus sp.]